MRIFREEASVRISHRSSLFEELHRGSFNRRLTPSVHLCEIINS